MDELLSYRYATKEYVQARIAEAMAYAGGGGGSTPVLISKNITANGVYNAADDNADGFSSVYVAVDVGIALDQLLARTSPSGNIISDTATTIAQWCFYGWDSGLTSIRCKNVVSCGNGAFTYSSFETICLPSVVLGNNNKPFESCNNLKTLVIGTVASNNGSFSKMCVKLEKIDITNGTISNYAFQNCSVINTIILRSSAIQGIDSNTFVGVNSIQSGGTGVTIYIPQSLYSHLGDGTANDYKAATNWSTLDGYGTITWAKIEGSVYENAYADGTPIS